MPKSLLLFISSLSSGRLHFPDGLNPAPIFQLPNYTPTSIPPLVSNLQVIQYFIYAPSEALLLDSSKEKWKEQRLDLRTSVLYL